MNPRLSSRFAACVLALLAACAILPGVGSRVSAAEVNATFTSAATVPVTAANYTATGNAVEFALNFTPPVGTNLTVVKNTGLGLIDGAFDNLAQGQKVSLTYGGISYPFVANYYGGTGNDLVLQWANRRLLAWGANTSGQLGNNTLTNSSVPVAVDMSGVLAGKALMNVAAGGLHCLALCADGTVVAWGANSDGQLGNRSTTDSWVPVAVNQAGAAAGKIIIAVAAGENHSLALGADGTVAAWGNNTNGQLGNGGTTTSTEPVPVDQTGVLAGKTVVALAAGYNYSLVLCADGTLAAWGWNFNGALGNGATAYSSVPVLVNRTGVLAGKTVTSISAGGSGNAVGSFSLAVCSDGTVAGWGVNGSGQLGNGSTTPSNVPVAVTQSGVLSGKTVVAAAAEDYSGVVLCSNGTIAAWGSNYSGGLGNSTNTNSLVPVLVTQTGVLSGKTVATIAAGHGHAFALCTDATLAAWGFNSYGQVGNNTFTSSNVPVLVNTSALRTGERFSAIRGGNNHSLAVTASPPPPVATTLAASGISDTGATLNGSVAANGNTTTLSFEYGLTTSYGTAVSATPASLTGTAASAITDLTIRPRF
jgi:alpha-tubulin suppressor-like RCC1 family protein